MANSSGGRNAPSATCGLCSARPPTGQTRWCERCRPLAAVVALARYDAVPRGDRCWGWMRGRQEVEKIIRSLGGLVESSQS